MTDVESADEASLGVRVAEDGLHAALASPNGEGASFCLYDRRAGDRARADDARRRRRLRGPRSRASAPARVTASASTGPSISRAAIASTSSKLLADPYAAAFDRPFNLHPSMSAFGEDSGQFAPKAIALAPPANGDAGREQRRAPRRSSSTNSIFAASRVSTPDDPGGPRAGLSPASPIPRSVEHLGALGVTSGRDHAGRRLRRRAPSAAARARPTPGATIPSSSARPTRVSRPAAGRRCAPRPTRCTRRASRRSSTSSSTTTARATNSGRRCRFAGSTTPPISACCPRISRATSTTWAAAIASRSTGPSVVDMALAALRRWMTWGGDRRLPL